MKETPSPERGDVMAGVPLAMRRGRFYSVLGDHVIIADDVRTVVEQRYEAGFVTTLDEGFLRGFLSISLDDDATPFREVRRLPPGSELRFTAAGGAQVRRVLPSGLPAALLAGRAANSEYLRVFDASVDAGQARTGSLVVMMSGGLDSTFLVASLVRHATPERPVQALVNVPVSAAQARSVGRWDADEYAVAELLAAQYPDRITLTRVRNDDGVLGLDAAAQHSQAAWWPVLNPANQVWLTQMTAMALGLGADVIFTGSMGNFAYSAEHSYAFPESLRGRQWRQAMSVLRAQRYGGKTYRQIARQLRRESTGMQNYRSALGVPEGAVPPGPVMDGRERFLRALLSIDRPYASWASPRALGGLEVEDPFAAHEVVEAAASIRLDTWHEGPAPRAFARAVAKGRLPDGVRLRTRRGLQSADAWWHARNQRDRYFDELALLESAPALGGWLDPAPTRARLEGWPWGEQCGPPRLELLMVDRVLSLAAFARSMRDSLLELARTPTGD